VEILEASRSLRVSPEARSVEDELRKAMLRSIVSISGGDNYSRSDVDLKSDWKLGKHLANVVAFMQYMRRQSFQPPSCN
jgi:hypothetical protein